MGIPIVGFEAADLLDCPHFQPWIPEGLRPRAIFPEARTVTVIRLPVTLPIVETAT